MPGQAATPEPARVLEPFERISEVFFGLIMVLGFTGSLSVATAERADVRTMLVGALGCNLAWGIIDGVLYLMGNLSEHGRRVRALRELRAAADPAAGRRLLADALHPDVASALTPAELEAVRERLLLVPDRPSFRWPARDEWKGALAVFLWVFLTTFPVAVPFLFMHEVHHALRVSNLVAVTLLFVTGWAFGRSLGYHPWRMGLGLVLLGGALVGLTMALGG